MIKVLVLEDEDAAAKRLQKLITEILPEAEFLATIESVKQGVEWFEYNSLPDLIFADIQLNDGTSFDIFRKVEIKSPVIFTTAYDEHALHAFKLNSVDYLLKPIKKGELNSAIEKFKSLHLTGKKSDNDNLHQLLEALLLSVVRSVQLWLEFPSCQILLSALLLPGQVLQRHG